MVLLSILISNSDSFISSSRSKLALLLYIKEVFKFLKIKSLKNNSSFP